jgi:hypothetical protein
MTDTAEVVILFDVTVGTGKISSHWRSGPYEISYKDQEGRTVITDGPARGSNFPSHVNPYLFNRHDAKDGVRFHFGGLSKSSDVHDESGNALGVIRLRYGELLLATETGLSRRRGVLAIHADAESDTYSGLTRMIGVLTHSRGEDRRTGNRGARAQALIKAEELANGLRFDDQSDTSLDTEPQVYPILLVTPPEAPAQSPSENAVSASADEDFLNLYCAATGQARDGIHASPAQLEAARSRVLQWSNSWRALVARHGAAFQLQSTTDLEFPRLFRVYFHSLYIDALMLARLQGTLVRDFEREVGEAIAAASEQTNPEASRRRFNSLDRTITLTSAQYRMHGAIANTGRTMEVLRAYQTATEFPARLRAVEAQVSLLRGVADRDARTAEEDSNARKENAVKLIASIAIPVTFCTDMFQLLQLDPSVLNLTALGAAMLAAGFAIWITVGRVGRARGGQRLRSVKE